MKQKDIDNILKANKKLDWVKRLYEKDTPSIVLPGQEYPSTHYMESSDNLVYPTIIRNADGKLEYLGNKARDYAIKTNTAIKLGSEEDANWFGENYKKGTNVLKQFKKGGKVEPIYTDNPKDKRLKAYNDSLSLYKKYPNNKYAIESTFDNLNSVNNNVQSGIDSKTLYPNLDFANNNKIKPTKVEWAQTGGGNYTEEELKKGNWVHYNVNGSGANGVTRYFTYKKPVQPIIYKKETGVPVPKTKFSFPDEQVEQNNIVDENYKVPEQGQGYPLPDYLTQTVKTPNGIKTYIRKDRNSAWVEQYKNGGKITAETIYSMNKQPKVILTPNDIYAKDGAKVKPGVWNNFEPITYNRANDYPEAERVSLSKIKNPIEGKIYIDDERPFHYKEGRFQEYYSPEEIKQILKFRGEQEANKTSIPSEISNPITNMLYNVDSPYREFIRSQKKGFTYDEYKDGGIVQAWVQKFTNGGMAAQQNYLDLNRINNENIEKAGQTYSSGSAGGGMMGGSGMMGGGGMDMFSGMFKAMKQSIDNKKLEGRNKKQKEVNLHNATINPYINSYQQFDDPNQMSQSDNQINNSTPEMTWDNEEGDNTATKSKFDSFTMQMGKPGTAGAMLDQIGDMAYASSQQASQAMNMMGGQSGGGQGGGMDMSQMMSMFKKKYGGYVADGGYNASYMDFMNTNQSLKGQLPSYLSNAQVNTNQISSQNYLNNVTPMQTKGTQSLTNNTTQRVSATPNKSMMGADGKQASGATPKGNGLTSSIGGVFSKVDEGVQSLYDGVGAMTDADSGAGAWFQGGAKAGQIAGKYTEGLKNIPVYGEIIAAAIDSVARFTGGALNVRDRQEYNKMKDRQDKVDEYKSRQAPLVYDPNKKGQYMAKYGANPKMMEQRIIDDIYSDFDKHFKLK